MTGILDSVSPQPTIIAAPPVFEHTAPKDVIAKR
jgi:hypothetical protein